MRGRGEGKEEREGKETKGKTWRKESRNEGKRVRKEEEGRGEKGGDMKERKVRVK